MKYNSYKSEILARYYLRFNGYFCVENFIVHAGDDPTKISGQVIGNHTETDILAVRHRNSMEVSGNLQIQNDPLLSDDSNSKIDFLVVEVKTGNENAPNKIWRTKETAGG